MLHFFSEKIRKHKLFLLFLPASVFLLCSLFYYHTNHAFLAFTDAMFQREITSDTLNLHYTLNSPAAFGIEQYAVSFGSADPQSRSDAFDLLAEYQKKLKKFPRFWLSAQNRLTFDILQLSFETQKKCSHYVLYDEPLGPTLGTQAQLPILLAEYHFSDKQDVEEYLALLTQIPDYYASLLQFEQEKADAGLFMNDVMAQGIIDQCQAFLQTGADHFLFSTFETRLAQIAGLTEKEKQHYQAQNRKAVETCVFPAYRTLSDGVAALKGRGKNDRGLCYYPNGKNYYTYLVQDSVGCYNKIDDIVKRIQFQLEQDIQSLKLLVKEQPQLLQSSFSETLEQSVSAISNDPETILEELKQKMTADFPRMENVDYDVRYAEPSLEDYLSPAFYLTAPLDDRNRNVIYINRGAGYRNLDLYSTLAHEGYPGHLYQTVYSRQTGCDPARSLFHFGGYIEGWATYVEMMSFSYADVPEMTAELYRLNRSLTLGISSLLDIFIHYYGYDKEQTAAFLAPFGFSGEEIVDSFYNLILEAPANYLKYYLGYLCFEDLQKAARKKEGDRFSLQQFHQKILETGPCPFPILYNRVLQT